MKLTTEQRTEIARAYHDELEPMIKLATRFGVTRVAIWKILRSAGINTTKLIASRIPSTCYYCQKPIIVKRCVYRNRLHNFCNQSCYVAWLNRQNLTNPLISSRQGMRIARKTIAATFDLQPENIVHHEDRNNKNNSPDNLRVFANSGDHVKYHRGFPITPLYIGKNQKTDNLEK
jgi:hypothetical protein